jgi:hypothetical protein
VRGFGPKKEVGVEVNGRFRAAGAVDADRDAGARSFLEVAVHAKGDLDVALLGEKDLTHRDGLEWLLRHVAEDVRGIEPDLGPVGSRHRRRARSSVEPEDVVER